MATNNVSRKREIECMIPSTTVLKLFKYPHKFGGASWCVGVERQHKSERGTFVSQTFFTEWSEDYEHHLKEFNSWKQALDCA